MSWSGEATRDGLARSRRYSQAHRCPQCRGELRGDAALQTLRCLHCGHEKKVGASARTSAIVEYDLEHGLAQASSRGYGTPTRSAKCGECGASVHFGEKGTATHCAFCGSPQVLERQASRQVIKPESLIPFRVSKADADTLRSLLAKVYGNVLKQGRGPGTRK